MLDNEEPWMPPKPLKQTEILKISSQVPEVTIIDGESSGSKHLKNNFLRRALSIEKSQQKTSQPPQIASNSPTIPHSIPQVPDLTILDEEVKSKKSSPSSNGRIFSESYKQMLINTHDQFKKQHTKSPIDNKQPKRSGILSSKQPFDYKPNPLCKYVPSKIESNSNNNVKDGNSSSILIDVDKISSPPKQQLEENKADKEEDLTFRKVANMLSEIQKLVVSPRVSSNGTDNNNEKPLNDDIIRKLALKYLSAEEYSFYDIDNEFQ